MAFQILSVDYFYATVEDHPGQAYDLLSLLAKQGVNLLALNGMPVGVERTQLTLFPVDTRKMQEVARSVGLALDGPHRALLLQGDDELGALAGVHAKLHKADVNVYASSGVTDGHGSYGYILYVRPEEYQSALKALEM